MNKKELIEKLKAIKGNKIILLDLSYNNTFLPEEEIRVMDWNSERIVIGKANPIRET